MRGAYGDRFSNPYAVVKRYAMTPWQPLISASLLAADGARLGQEVQDLDRAQVDWIHLDIMDGHFVPDLTFGPGIVRALRPWTTRPFDVHVMCQNPNLSAFVQAGANSLTFHPSTVADVPYALAMIQDMGCRAGLALNLGEDPQHWPREWFQRADLILVMAVAAGKGGQAFDPSTGDRVRFVRAKAPYAMISVDGGITDRTAPLVPQADVLVSGSFLLRHPQGLSYQDAVQCLRQACAHPGYPYGVPMNAL
jgi:ribulose-phosphate 3-epimerase